MQCRRTILAGRNLHSAGTELKVQPSLLIPCVSTARSLTAATNKTAQLAVEVPKGLTVSYKSFRSVAPVPGQSKAFALGMVGCTDGRTPSQMHGALYWSGGTAWKFIKACSGLIRVCHVLAWLSRDAVLRCYRCQRLLTSPVLDE